MRLVWIGVLTVPLFAQMRVGNAMAGIRGPEPAARRPAPAPHRGNGYWAWGLGYGGAAVVVPTTPEVKAPILASSPLYQADRAQPVMREYGSLPAETTSIEVASCWVVGEQFADRGLRRASAGSGQSCPSPACRRRPAADQGPARID